jgi:hypothetical protein
MCISHKVLCTIIFTCKPWILAMLSFLKTQCISYFPAEEI